ncbi:hypothetical protein BJ546DRAFT_202045 [Cryomyces antarcticus]
MAVTHSQTAGNKRPTHETTTNHRYSLRSIPAAATRPSERRAAARNATAPPSTLPLKKGNVAKEKAFPFPRLPPELRNRIYSLVVIRPWKVAVRLPLGISAHLPPPLTQVCQQIRLECLPIFYGCNKFFYDTTLLRARAARSTRRACPTHPTLTKRPLPPRTSWFESIGSASCRMLRNLQVVMEDRYEREGQMKELVEILELEGVRVVRRSFANCIVLDIKIPDVTTIGLP